MFWIIKREVALTGKWPSSKSVADEMGWRNPSGVADALASLARYGLVRRVQEGGPVMSRYELVPSGDDGA